MRASRHATLVKLQNLYILKNIYIDKTLRFMLTAFENFKEQLHSCCCESVRIHLITQEIST